MATEVQLSRLRDVLGYGFKDIYLLKQALTTADRNREHPDEHHDGNRGLAFIREQFIQFAISDKAFTVGASRSIFMSRRRTMQSTHPVKAVWMTLGKLSQRSIVRKGRPFSALMPASNTIL